MIRRIAGPEGYRIQATGTRYRYRKQIQNTGYRIQGTDTDYIYRIQLQFTDTEYRLQDTRYREESKT